MTNPWAMAALGDYVYVADWDGGKVVEVDPADDWNETGAYFDFSTDAVTEPLLPDDYQANCTALLVIGSELYSLFSLGLPPYYNTYAASVLVRFTINPTNTIEVDSSSDCNDVVEKNA